MPLSQLICNRCLDKIKTVKPVNDDISMLKLFFLSFLQRSVCVSTVLDGFNEVLVLISVNLEAISL